MIPTKNDRATLTGSLSGQVTQMTIRAQDFAHIQSVLTDLYSDPEAAIIREYPTNARDSHAMAGVTRPIEVSLPTPLRQTFEVKDFGEGLTVEGVQETFGFFGGSTKRETNDATGCLGLGSKSALTYTNMFTVRAVRNGVLTVAAIYRSDTGIGSVEIVDTCATDEGNGVTVIIPTAGSTQFEAKSHEFFKHWPKGSVLIDGVEPVHAFDSYIKVSDKVFIKHDPDARRGYWRSDNESKKSVIVMGGVSYPAHIPVTGCYNVIYLADMDEVNFVPSREELHLTNSTKAVIDSVAASVSEDALLPVLQARIEDATDLASAMEAWHDLRKMLYDKQRTVFYWRGIKLLDNFSFDVPVSYWNENAHKIKDKKGSITSIDVTQAARGLWITGRPADTSLFASHKAKIRAYDSDDTKVVYFGAPPKHPLFAHIKPVKWSKIDAIEVKMPPRQKGGSASKAEYEWRTESDRVWYKRPLPSTGQLVINAWGSSPLMEEYPDHVFVTVSDRRMAKFLRENPTAITTRELRDQTVKAFVLTDVEKLRLGLESYRDYRVRGLLKELVGKTNDPMIDKIAAVDPKRIEKARKLGYNGSKNYFEENYPLAGTNNIDHSVIYINALLKGNTK